MKNILITGVSGYLGGKIAKELADKDDVSTLVGIDIRTPENPPKNLIFINHDVRRPMIDLFRNHDIDTVIHAAYVLAPVHDKSFMEEINISGTKNVLAAAEAAGISHLMYTSSTTAYGFHPDNPFPLEEDSPLRGNDDFTYAKNKKEIEFLMGDFIKGNPEIAVTVLRPCFVVGAGFDNTFSHHLQKKLVMLPSNHKPFQFVHEDDFLRALILCLEKKVRGAFNIAGEGTFSLAEAARMLGNIPVLLPFGLVYILNQIGWILRLSFLTEFPSQGLNLIRYSWVASPDRFVKQTGFEYQYNTKTAFEDFVNSVKSNK
jgi:UDP-glucose 4-epimerase